MAEPIEIDERYREPIEQALAAPYTRIFQKEEDGGYSAQVLELPGCYTAGDSIEETNEFLEEAMALWIEVVLENGHDIPPPLDFESFSGRLTFRIPPTLHERAYIRAQLEGVSLNRLLSTAVAAYMGDTARSTALPTSRRQRELVLREEEAEFSTDEPS